MVTDYSRKKGHRRTSFDEECLNIQYEADNTDNATDKTLRDLIQKNMHILKPKNKKSLKACQSCLCQSNDSTSFIHEHPSNSAEISFNRLGIAPQDFRRSDVLVKHDYVDTNLQQRQMSGKTLVDYIFSESKPFSQALEVLNSDKDLIIELLSEPNCRLQKCSTCPTYQQSQKRATLKEELQNGKSFSVREIKRKLKHTFGSRRKDSHSNQVPKFTTSGKLSHNRSIFRQDCIYSGVDARSPLSSTTNAKKKEDLGRKQGLKVEMEPHVDWESDTARRKIDFSSNRLFKKHGVDAALDARLKDLNAAERVIFSDSCLSPRRESLYFSCSAQGIFSPYRERTCLSVITTTKEVTVTSYDSTTKTLSTDGEEKEAEISPTQNMKLHDIPNVAETNTRHSEEDHCTMISNVQRASNVELYEEYGSLMHSIDSSTVDDFSSSPTSMSQLDMHDSNKNHDQEHQSPISVLDQFFAENCRSPSNTAFNSSHDPLKPRRLHFEAHTLASPSQDPTIISNAWMHEQDYTISNYVRVIIQASSLDWDQISAIRPFHENLLHPSLFDQAQFLFFNLHFDTRLLFDHINEVLVEMQRSLFISPCWPVFMKPRICNLPLEETVIDEIMREAEFYLLPQTQKRTLDQLVAKDLSGSKLQPDIRPEIEQIIIHISEDILVESILDVILQLHSWN